MAYYYLRDKSIYRNSLKILPSCLYKLEENHAGKMQLVTVRRSKAFSRVTEQQTIFSGWVAFEEDN